MKKGLFVLFCLGLFIMSCNNDDDILDPVAQEMVDQEIIDQYLTDNSITATEHESGMHYIITEEGTGTEMPSGDSNVEVKYRGYFTDGNTFDQTSGDNTITFALNGVIQGWQIALPLLKKGGKGTFFFPSALAYGPFPPQGIPANAVLIFDIELIDFN